MTPEHISETNVKSTMIELIEANVAQAQKVITTSKIIIFFLPSEQNNIEHNK